MHLKISSQYIFDYQKHLYLPEQDASISSGKRKEHPLQYPQEQTETKSRRSDMETTQIPNRQDTNDSPQSLPQSK
jgi:hypothetical protein